MAEQNVFHNPQVNYDVLYRKPFFPREDRMSKVRSTFRQCVRDWSAEGQSERDQCYKPILDELERLYPDKATRGDIKVLVPGSGLGRLVWEVAHRGFWSQGNEFSYFMLLASYVILNCMQTPECLTLYPFIYDTKNLLNAEDQFRTIKIPDVNPTTLPPDSNFSMVAGDFLEVFSDKDNHWDCVTTCFFLDTANNILDYIRAISTMLKVGGHWINFGPLLYHFADIPGELSIELAWDELKPLLPTFGLKLLKEESGQPSIYTGNKSSMMTRMYHCLSFTVVKVGECPIKPWVSPSSPAPTLLPVIPKSEDKADDKADDKVDVDTAPK